MIACREAGAEEIVVTGLAADARKLELAREFGARHTKCGFGGCHNGLCPFARAHIEGCGVRRAHVCDDGLTAHNRITGLDADRHRQRLCGNTDEAQGAMNTAEAERWLR